jgi:hypothetical protein
LLSAESRRLAGILLVVFPTVIYGGISLLLFLIGKGPGYLDNPIRQNLFRAGHAYAGVLLVLSLVALRYVDEAGAIFSMESRCPEWYPHRGNPSSGRFLSFRRIARRKGTRSINLSRVCRGGSAGGRADHLGCRITPATSGTMRSPSNSAVLTGFLFGDGHHRG